MTPAAPYVPVPGHASPWTPAATTPIGWWDTLFGTWLVLNFLFGGVPLADLSLPLPVGAARGLYVSQFTLVVVCLIALLRTPGPRALGKVATSVLIVAAAYVWTGLSEASAHARFVPEFTKSMLLVVPAVLLWGHIGWREVRVAATLVPTAVLGVAIFVQASGQGNFYGNLGRFGVPWWGSPNTTAFVISLAVALQLYGLSIMRLRGGGRLHFLLSSLPSAGVLVGLLGFLVATDSDGGMLTTAAIVFRYFGVRLRYLIAGFVVLMGAVLVLEVEVPALVGSGRLLIWRALLDDFVHADAWTWIVGRGPGSINFRPWFTANVLSAHSMYVEALVTYGAPILALLLFALGRFSLRLSGAALHAHQRLLLEAVFAAVAIGFAIDTYLMTAQLVWIGAMLFAAGHLVRQEESSRGG